MKKLIQLEWHNEKRKISDLIPYESNPRQLTDKQYSDLKKSLTKFNLAEIPAINLDNKICAGHQRLKIMSEVYGNDFEIDVRVPNRKMTEKEFQEYNIRSNKNTGEFSFDILANEFEIEDLTSWGFEEFELGIGIGAEFPEMAEGDGSGFQQMTFTLSDTQVETVKNALRKAKEDKAEDPDNQNSNGNALYKICAGFLNGN